ncbi:MAG TPA: hypothetical protein VIC57_16395 [Candidatus Dormibacteraeota bacterium]|jgi:hypothetical protein
MGSGKVSAIPGELTSWAGWARGLDDDLRRAGRRVDEAVAGLNESGPDSGILGHVPDLGADVIGYAARNGATDAWVGQVGEAFYRIETRDVPPQVLRGESDSFWHGVATVSESDLTAQVGADPSAEGREDGDAAAAAERLRSAYRSGDDERVRQLVERLGGHARDWDAAFFEELAAPFDGYGGPELISDIGWALSPNDRSLRAYDEALGRATRSPSWDPSLNQRLLESFDPTGQGDPQARFNESSRRETALLRFGTYSPDFLERAFDVLVATPLRNPDALLTAQAAGDPEVVDQFNTVLGALSGSPEAAAAVLAGSGETTTSEADTVRGTWARVLLTFYGKDVRSGRALGDAISAAGRSNDDALKHELLHGIGNVDWQIVPDDARAGIADAVASNVDLLSRGAPDAQGDEAEIRDRAMDAGFLGEKELGWKQRLFVMAELDHDGTVDSGRQGELTRHLQAWVGAHPDAKAVGWMFGMAVVVPQVKGDQVRGEYHMPTGALLGGQAVGTALGFVPDPVSMLSGAALSWGDTAWAGILSDRALRKQLGTDETELKDLAQSKEVVKLQYVTLAYAGDGAALPATMRDAAGDDPAVVARIQALADREGPPSGQPPYTSRELAFQDRLPAVENGVNDQFENANPRDYN